MVLANTASPEMVDEHISLTQVLTRRGIMEKHNLQPWQFEQMRRQLISMQLLDILFSFPDGPRRDIALHLFLTSR
jgi:hypothetical protein